MAFIVKKIISSASILIKRDAIFKILRPNPLGNFWNFTQNLYNKTISNFNLTYAGGQVDINWGEESVNESIPNNTNISHTFGNTTQGISILARNGANITNINCGVSSVPRLSGTVDISAFPNLQGFTCNSNDITALSGYAQNSNLINVQFYNNKVTGPIPTLSGLTGLQTFLCFSNLLTGPIPALSGSRNLQNFQCYSNQLTGPIPTLSGLTGLQTFLCFSNLLTGPIPALSGLRNLQNFQCYSNQLTGPIPTLSGLTGLQTFICQDNLLSGPIPALSGLTNLVDFRCKNNPLGGSIPSLSGLNNLQNFQCQINSLVGSIPALTGSPVLNTFLCDRNNLTGPIPSLNGLSAMQDFRCHTNQLTNYAGGSVSNTLGNFQANSNQLTSAAVNAILAAFVTANKTTGTRVLNLGGVGNGAPTGQGITDKATLISRGWTVTTN